MITHFSVIILCAFAYASRDKLVLQGLDSMDKDTATRELSGKNLAYKNELLFTHGINYNDLPAWQKREFGVYFRNVEKEGVDSRTNTEVITERRELYTDLELPLGTEYRKFVLKFLEDER